MELDKRALDRYITREPDWYDEDEDIGLICQSCGRDLPRHADGKREEVRIRHCSGEPKLITAKYGDGCYDEQLLSIIGEEHRGEEYQIAYPPDCGTKEGSCHADFDGDIDPKKIEEYRHEPHFYVEDVWGYQLFEIRTCECGHQNEEPVI